jgi:hypothetical protein
MSDLDIAFEKHMKYIVKEEKRPFCVLDFINFTHEGRDYSVRNGTFRNKISLLKAEGKVIKQYRTTHAYYSIPDYDFKNRSVVTSDHAGLPIKSRKETAIYKWVNGRPKEKQSLHDIRLTFSAKGIWQKISISFQNNLNESNKDVKLDTLNFDDIEVKCTIHHSDTVSVSIACSSRPIVIDFPDTLYLAEILTRTEIMIQNLCLNTPSDISIIIPRYTTWIAKMWHFGNDNNPDRCDGKEFHITFQDGIGDLWRIYTKRLKNDKVILRTERQEYPGKPAMEAVLEKIFSEGFIK